MAPWRRFNVVKTSHALILLALNLNLFYPFLMM
jgi:hypothetical protein